MIMLSVDIGLQWGEPSGLTEDDLGLELEALTVRGARAKSGTTRHLALNAVALLLLTLCQIEIGLQRESRT